MYHSASKIIMMITVRITMPPMAPLEILLFFSFLAALLPNFLDARETRSREVGKDCVLVMTSISILGRKRVGRARL